MATVFPCTAPVRPRVIHPSTGEVRLLSDVIEEFAAARGHGVILIVGGPGAGKTTALQHLAGTLPSTITAELVDGVPAVSSTPRLLIGTSSHLRIKHIDLFLPLAPWTDDDCIEYMLLRHHDACASVMERLRTASDRRFAQGNPQLTTIILDRFTADESLTGVRAALRREFDSFAPPDEVREDARKFALASLFDKVNLKRKQRQVIDEMQQRRRAAIEAVAGLWSLLRHESVRVLLAAEEVVQSVGYLMSALYPHALWPSELIRETAALIPPESAFEQSLLEILATGKKNHDYQPLAASLLHATGRGWRPTQGGPLNLSRAVLSHAAWREIDLSDVNLTCADLSAANLEAAQLDLAILDTIDLTGARLSRATLRCVDAYGANLSRCDLSDVIATDAGFRDANLSAASLRNSDFRKTDFSGANLSGAVCDGAMFGSANFKDADLREASFVGVDFEAAKLSGRDLSECDLTGANFPQADLSGCRLEGVDLPGADFHEANLSEAILTDARMPGASFQRANLREARLAEIDWENADLRGADLTGCTFHMGTSRSGLLDSPIASEGSRTGFYTDDYSEQHFKSPEEIRKANLRGADLRGAKITGVDFYLVDLRDALYDDAHREQLERTGAILVDRA